MKGVLLFLAAMVLASNLRAQSSWIIEFGFRGIIPEVFTDTHTVEDGGRLVTVHQRALPQRDYAPFPWVAQGFVLNVLESYNKFSVGWGYSFHYDYHTLSASNAEGLEDFTAKIQNNIIYALARVNLKHEHKHSVFVGAKLGLMLTVEGYGDDLGLLNSLAVEEDEAFDAYPANSVSPGLYGAVQLGLKLYLYKKSKTLLPGIKVIAELGGATPTLSTGKHLLNDSKTSVVGVDNRVKYRSNYSHFGIQLMLFFEVLGKKPFIFRSKFKEEKPPGYEQF